MARIAIVGGHGKIAQQLIGQLAGAGHTPVALIRKPEQVADLEQLGAETAIVDIENDDAATFAQAFAGADAVVFTAGGGADGDIARKKSVDLGGSVKSVDGAKQAGVSRFVQVSAISVDEPVADDAGDVWKAYVDAKRDADTQLRDSGLDWTIVRPGGLTDDPATGQVALAEKVERGDVPRADVAAFIVAALDDPRTVGKQWELVSGDVALAEAISAAV
ncbi:SDR family oxidoreductase [Solicola sp. PLA-1-18]|uniref:SDR family oxidoreductase n=1 Tax=Solicola sp. PLA-1-18 TaxID=3380532 RepID=UPI003B79BDE6